MLVDILDPSLFTLPYDLSLAEALARAGHRVRLVGRPLRRGEEAFASPLLTPAFYRWYEALPEGSGWKRSWVKGLAHVADAFRYVDDCRRRGVEVVHVQWTPLPVVDALLLRRLARFTRVVMTVHDTEPFCGHPTSSLQLLGAGAALGQAHALIVHSEYSRRALSRMRLRQRTHVVPHGLIAARGAGAASASTRQGDRIVFLCFGALKPYKGIDLLLHALAGIPSDERGRMAVRVVGRPYLDADALRAEAVRLGVDPMLEWDLRFVPEEEIPSVFASADAAVFPYRRIDTSGAAMLAVHFGLPSIVTDVGGLGELFGAGRGQVVPAADAAALGSALRRFAADAELRSRLREATRRLRAEMSSWDDIGRITSAVYATAGAVASGDLTPEPPSPRA